MRSPPMSPMANMSNRIVPQGRHHKEKAAKISKVRVEMLAFVIISNLFCDANNNASSLRESRIFVCAAPP